MGTTSTTGTTIEGGTSAKGLRIALVASRFNEFAVGKLLAGALECLSRQGADETDLLVVRVPGAWEIPVVARRLAEARRHDAVIALGVLIRGETAHFDLIASQVASGLAAAAEQTGVPVVFGVITAENADQALDRAGGKQGNRGWEAAKAAIEMAGVMKQMSKP